MLSKMVSGNMLSRLDDYNTFLDGSETPPKNPKIQTLIDEIMNDNGQGMDVISQKSVAVKQNSSPAR